jgi:hypothetical protein
LPKSPKKIKFTKHAQGKFEFLRKYRFDVSQASVEEAVLDPRRVDRRDDQLLALRPMDREYALRVVYRIMNDNIVVVTFYPVKRKRFDV